MLKAYPTNDKASLYADKAAIIAQCQPLGIKQVQVEYQGYTDSSYEETITVEPDHVVLAPSLAKAIDDFTHAMLENFHSNWCASDGGLGKLTIDIVNQQCDLLHTTFCQVPRHKRSQL